MNNIEEKFYITFGIESIELEYPDNTEYYPEITDRILLELICILSTVTYPDLGDINYARLRNAILEKCIESVTEVDWECMEPTKEEFINDVRSLFEGVEE